MTEEHESKEKKFSEKPITPAKSGGLTRRQMIALTAAGVAITLPAFQIAYRWANAGKVVVEFEGPFEECLSEETKYSIIEGKFPKWLSSSEITVAFASFDSPNISLVFDIKDQDNLPSTLVLNGFLFFSNGNTTRDEWSFNVREIVKSSRKGVATGIVTAKTPPYIETTIPIPAKTKSTDINKIRYEISWS